MNPIKNTPLETFLRKGIHSNSFDIVTPKSNSVEDVVIAFNERIEMIERLWDRPVTIMAWAKLNPDQCHAVLSYFPDYDACFQESGNCIIMTVL